MQFVIQALIARPPVPKSCLLPSTPSPHASYPSSPSGEQHNLNDPFFSGPSLSSPSQWRFEPKVPIFFFAQYAMKGVSWLEAAVLRDRGAMRTGFAGKERPGKRLM